MIGNRYWTSSTTDCANEMAPAFSGRQETERNQQDDKKKV